MGSDLPLMLMVFAPALVGIGALIGAWLLIVHRPAEGGSQVMRWIGVGALLLIAFGIGTCYTMVFYGEMW